MVKTESPPISGEYDYFIAGKWHKREVLLAIVRALEAKGKRPYCFVTEDPQLAGETDIEKVQDEFAGMEDWRQNPRLWRTFEMDRNALQKAHVFVLVQPAGISSSTESGMAHAWGKRCILVGDSPPDGNLNPDGDSLLLLFDECYTNPEAFLASITDSSTT